MDNTTPLLAVSDLTVELKSMPEFPLVSQLNFTINAGETVGFVGESGCGKSVTSLSIMRLFDTSIRIKGRILFKGEDLQDYSESRMQQLRGKDIGMIFQEPMTALNPVQSIGQQMDEIQRLHTTKSRADIRLHSIAMLHQVGLPRAEALYSQYPHELSGGMRQRVMIAMAMSLAPALLIADEPTTALDVTIQAQILDLMKGIKQHSSAAIMLITHDLGVVAEICDRVVVMYAGEIVEMADVNTLFANPQHPYTRGLMKSKPSLETKQAYLDSIPGRVPLITEMPKACRFAPRCADAIAQCQEQKPMLQKLDQSMVRCLRAGELPPSVAHTQFAEESV